MNVCPNVYPNNSIQLPAAAGFTRQTPARSNDNSRSLRISVVFHDNPLPAQHAAPHDNQLPAQHAATHDNPGARRVDDNRVSIEWLCSGDLSLRTAGQPNQTKQ